MSNLLSISVLAFALGVIAKLVRSDLRIPPEVYSGLTIFLLFTIGLRGGAELAETPFEQLIRPALATLALGIIIPAVAFVIAFRIGRLGVPDAAALAAHYGSVSAVTFAAALTFLDAANIKHEGFMPTLVALLEVPAIVVALLIAKSLMSGVGSMGSALREVFTGTSVVLLLGGLIIGAVVGKAHLAPVKPFFFDLYSGVLTIFLLDMGVVAAERIREIRGHARFLISFGSLVPLMNGTLGTALGTWSGLSIGGAAVLGVLAASASYIAAPAAVRVALPQANPSLYLTAALGVTFPLNLAIGIPLFLAVSTKLHGA